MRDRAFASECCVSASDLAEGDARGGGGLGSIGRRRSDHEVSNDFISHFAQLIIYIINLHARE